MIDAATRDALDRAIDSAKIASPGNALRALDVHDFARMKFKPRAEMLSPWLHSQDLCMVYAARGIGKTHFALSVAYAVATGGSFGPWSAAKPSKVLYLDGELPGAVMQQRCLMHCPDAEPLPGFLRVLSPDIVPEDDTLPDISTPEGQASIERSIEADTELIVIDNLSAWARTGRENDAESWHPIATWLLSLRRRGIAVLLVHHGGKNGQQRGTSKKEDLLDVVISLSRPKDYDPQQGAVFVLEFTKARNLTGAEAESLEFTLGGDENRAQWTFSSAEASTMDRVVARSKEGLSAGEIAEELSIHKSSVSRHLKKARELGLLPPGP
nr:AAA family ATPase [uncultured Roseateles sp.]